MPEISGYRSKCNDFLLEAISKTERLLVKEARIQERNE
jgi:hypothetical protein